MKFFKYLLSLVVLAGILNSCTDDDYTMLDGSAQAPTLTASGDTTFVLLSDNADAEATTLSWNEVNLNVNTPVTYILEMVLGGTDFTAPVTLQSSTATSFTMTVGQLNARAVAMGILPETTGTLDVRVKARIGESANSDLVSQTLTLTVTPYTDVLDLSTEWGVVGSATPNGWNGPDIPFWKQQGVENNGIIVAYANLVDGEIKFRMNNSWDAPNINYGGNSSTGGALVEGGANIPVTAGTYKITMNLNDLTYSIEPYSWGIVGSATLNGWDGPDISLEYDATSDQWRALTTLTDGFIKFRMNNSWDISHGGESGEPDTTHPLVLNGPDIPVVAGKYLITVNFNDSTYTLESVEYFWGIVGSATPNGWDGPDIPLYMDYTQDGVWYNNNVELVDGFIKFRADNSWDYSFGDTGLDGTLESDNGADIPVTAGNYTVIMDFSQNPDAPSYSIVSN